MRRRVLPVLLVAAALAGCGRAPLGATAAPVAGKVVSAQFTSDETERYRGKIAKLIRWYDRNGDGAIGAAESPTRYGKDTKHVDERFNDLWVLRTEIEYDLHRNVKSFSRLDRDKNGRATIQEVTDAYLEDRDTNGNNGIGLWERFKAALLTPSARFESRWYRETGRRQYFVYSPAPDPDRPAPPAVRPDPPPVPVGRSQPPLKVELPEE